MLGDGLRVISLLLMLFECIDFQNESIIKRIVSSQSLSGPINSNLIHTNSS